MGYFSTISSGLQQFESIDIMYGIGLKWVKSLKTVFGKLHSKLLIS